jgi:hypothetical protein
VAAEITGAQPAPSKFSYVPGLGFVRWSWPRPPTSRH